MSIAIIIVTKHVHINVAVLSTEIQGAHSIECVPICTRARILGIPRMRYAICRWRKSIESAEGNI